VPLKQALFGVLGGIGPRTAEELARRAGLDPEKLITSLIPAEMDTLWQAVEGFSSQLARAQFSPRLYLRDGEPIDCTPFPFMCYADLEVETYESISEALDGCHRGSRQEPFARLAHELAQVLKGRSEKVLRALAQVRRDLEQAENYEELKEMGDLLLANLHLIHKGQSQVEVEDFRGGIKAIPLDPKLDPTANAQRYYKRYKKLKRGVERLRARLGELEMELQYLQSLEVHLQQAETLEELWELQGELEAEGYLAPPKAKSRAAQSSGPRSYKLDGFTVLVGRSGRQNDELIRRAHGEDYWLHARDRPGAHVIIQCERHGARPPEGVLMRAAQLAAYYSKGRNSTKVPVTFTQVKYLRKPKGARPGLVLVTHEEGTLLVAPKEEE
jgi:predicted ribosome quality control (RQC) complex YloA/Tae2 family protein